MSWFFIWMTIGLVVVGFAWAQDSSDELPGGFITLMILWLIWPMILGGLLYEGFKILTSRRR